ncbi:hypothetical protein SEA_SCHIMMELS22_29 [Microbacterium phage Schimmels22]|nr:hypothetical protein SEA_SCHIMMELS22_29 [Microbacterium phage Schimmels22]
MASTILTPAQVVTQAIRQAQLNEALRRDALPTVAERTFIQQSLRSN